MRILSGMRPTGKLHIGHLAGVLKNWKELQKKHNCFFLIADIHTLTTKVDTSLLKENITEMVIDWFISGISPEKSVIFVQSRVPQHAELHLYFSMLITVARLQRNPTLKEQIRDLGLADKVSYGHLGYPVLQSVDILLYKGEGIPVGEDQVSHIELTREIARRFNSLYRKIFPEPKPLLTEFPRMLGTDGKRMQKSLNNAIFLSDTPESIEKKVKSSYTDPLKIRKTDPGHTEGCAVFNFHRFFNKEKKEEIEENCKKGFLGCVECKKMASTKIIESLSPYREARKIYNLTEIKEILEEGNKKASLVAQETMRHVKESMKMW